MIVNHNNQGTKTMKTAPQTVNPAQAAKWLEAHVNHDNRALRQGHVEYLAQQILDGKWQITHQGIAFSVTGRLIDGQHRLAAIVRAGKPVEILVSTGLDNEAFTVVDCGLKRAHFDRVHLVNDQAQNVVICQAVNQYLRAVHRESHAIAVSDIEDEFLSKTDAWMWSGSDFIGAHHKLRKVAVLAAFAIYHYVSKAKAQACAESYRNGTGLVTGSPVLKLRNHALGLEGGEPLTYWRAVSLMRAHLKGELLDKVFAAAEDMVGNKNSHRVIQARKRQVMKGIKTRVLKKGKA